MEVGHDVVVEEEELCPGRRQSIKKLANDGDVSGGIGRTNTEKFYTVEPPSRNDCHHFHFAEERDLCRRKARRVWVGHIGLFEAAVMPWRILWTIRVGKNLPRQ